MSSPSTITLAAWRKARRCSDSQSRVAAAGADDISAEGHVGIHVAQVVDEGAAGKLGDERAGQALERRIGHGHHDVGANAQGARHGQREIAEIVRDASGHAEAREGRGADALDRYVAFHFAAQQVGRMALGGIVGRPAAEDCDLVLLGKRLHDQHGILGRGRSIRRVVFVQDQGVQRLTSLASCPEPIRCRPVPLRAPQDGESENRRAPACPCACAGSSRWLPPGGRTMGSLSLKEVFTTAGTPVRLPNSRISFQ